MDKTCTLIYVLKLIKYFIENDWDNTASIPYYNSDFKVACTYACSMHWLCATMILLIFCFSREYLWLCLSIIYSPIGNTLFIATLHFSTFSRVFAMHDCCLILCVCLLHTLIFSFIFFVQTALHYAASNNETDIANLLLRFGADPQIVDEYGMCDLWPCCVSVECRMYSVCNDVKQASSMHCPVLSNWYIFGHRYIMLCCMQYQFAIDLKFFPSFFCFVGFKTLCTLMKRFSEFLPNTSFVWVHVR